MGYKKEGMREEHKEALEKLSTENATLWGIMDTPLTDFDEELLAGYYRAIANGGLKKLSKQERLYWKLAFFNWLSFSDIAKREGVTVNVVYTTIKRASKKIKQLSYKEVYKAPLDPAFTRQGFQKEIRTKYRNVSDGKNSARITDKLFNERLKAHEDEIQKWDRLHPEDKLV